MELGWIDFSKKERNKVLSVLDLLSEAGTLDELGIAPIRDGYANLFFPSTSTIQTKAKYFLCVPYALRDIERGEEVNFKRLLQALSAKEEACGKKLFLENPKSDGVIGRRALVNKSWVKRAPSDIYWAGIRRLGIFLGGNMSLSEYLRYLSSKKQEKNSLLRLGNRNDQKEESEKDDGDAGKDLYIRFWNLPTYTKEWLDTLSIHLTKAEALFLKQQILSHCKGSMYAYIMQENMQDIVDVKNFEDLKGGYIGKFPADIQADYYNAIAFSEFVYPLRVLYNIIVFDGKNQEANDEWDKLQEDLSRVADIDFASIYRRLGISNITLLRFLQTAQEQMKNGDIEGLKETIIRREVQLKGESRAKTKHVGEFVNSTWIGGRRLDYRFPDAQTIIKDIFEGEKNCAESK